jgi:hypothetical protein
MKDLIVLNITPNSAFKYPAGPKFRSSTNDFIHSYYRMTQPLADPRGVIDYGDVDFNQDADFF